MFTGIIESTGMVRDTRREAGNLWLKVESDISPELSIDQSVSHNGVCLTVVDAGGPDHTVTVIRETQERSNLGSLKAGDRVNLERCLPVGGRFDGHIVQGHVDQTARCVSVEEQAGSHLVTFSYDGSTGNLTVEKGSICVDGISLTVVQAAYGEFSVAIIPYTYEHTCFKFLQAGDTVNLEFDIIGKYVAELMKRGGRG